YWCESIGIDARNIVTVRQEHDRRVLRVGHENAGHEAQPGSRSAGTADALITDELGIVLMTLHADCLPILIVDPDRPAIAAVHAGWRGTVTNVVGATVHALVESYDSRPDRLLAILGPGIGPCCYQVGPEVVAAWRNSVVSDPEQALLENDQETIFNLWTANVMLLRHAGLQTDRLESTATCTRCDSANWFSHRSQGPNTGRSAALISLRAAST
ncbi:MAG: peptidoglycan editing factor PgeF, partial [Chloroflexota bacterium]|nr:peptidoglycan editing factor PgeF [Chloroflexota bacterium]